VGLGRFHFVRHGARSRVGGRTDDRGVSSGEDEEGNVVSVRQAYAPERHRRFIATSRSGTRPSLAPETRSASLTLFIFVKSDGRTDIAVGQTHESGRNRHRGRNERDVARLAACHRFRKEESVVRQKRKVVTAIVPARNGSPELSVRTSWLLQKLVGIALVSNKHARSAPKRVAVRVNGNLVGPSREKSEDSPPGRHRRKGRWCVGLHHESGETPA
jgi:hypothetical protein